MDKLKKLEVASEFTKLSKDSLAVLFAQSYLGGTRGISGEASAYSCGCDATAICNCPPPPPFCNFNQN